jgi:hypothetical protein
MFCAVSEHFNSRSVYRTTLTIYSGTDSGIFLKEIVPLLRLVFKGGVSTMIFGFQKGFQPQNTSFLPYFSKIFWQKGGVPTPVPLLDPPMIFMLTFRGQQAQCVSDNTISMTIKVDFNIKAVVMSVAYSIKFYLHFFFWFKRTTFCFVGFRVIIYMFCDSLPFIDSSTWFM